MAAGLAVLALTAACGSTVQVGEERIELVDVDELEMQDPDVFTEDDELTLDPVEVADGSDAGSPAPGQQTSSSAGAGPSPSPQSATPTQGTTGSPSSGQSGSNEPAPAQQQPASDGGAIPIGILYADDGEGALAAFGGSGTRGDERAEYETLIADVNARGGVNGRPLEVIYYMTPFTSSDPEGDQQAACAHFTQDNEVFAVLTSRGGGTSEAFKRCLEQAGVIHIQANFSFAGEQTYARNPHYVEPANIELNRSAASYVPTLARQDYFSGWNHVTGQSAPGAATVAVVTLDEPTFAAAVDGVLLPALEREGHNDTDVARVNSTSAGAQSQEIANAVLRFRQRGVSHVIFFGAGGNPPLLFLNQAASQGYRPRYAFTSQELPSLLLELGVFSDPDGQLRGSMGMGWWPPADLPLGGDPFTDRAQTQRCLQVLAEDGHRHPTALRTSLALIHCDVVYFLEAALEAAGPELSRASFRQGLDRVGASFAPSFTIATRVSAQWRDGTAAVNDWQYDSGCSCFRYVGQPRRIR